MTLQHGWVVVVVDRPGDGPTVFSVEATEADARTAAGSFEALCPESWAAVMSWADAEKVGLVD